MSEKFRSIHEYGIGDCDELLGQDEIELEISAEQEREFHDANEQIIKTGRFHDPSEDFLK